MKFEKFSKEMLEQAKVNEDAFSELCPRVGTERLTFMYGEEQHSATIHMEGGEEVLIYDGILEF